MTRSFAIRYLTQIALLSCLAWLVLTHAAFAAPIFLQLTPAGGGGDCEQGGTCSVVNPLFRAQGIQNQNQLYTPSSISIDGLYDAIPAALFAQAGVTDLTIALDFEPVISVVPQTAGTYVFSLSVSFNDVSSLPVTQLDAEIDLAFDVPLLVAGGGSDGALGYLDETRSPPIWVSEGGLDNCGSGGGASTVCGKTDHFTLFSLSATPVPEPGTGLLVGLGLGLLSRVRSGKRRDVDPDEGA